MGWFARMGWDSSMHVSGKPTGSTCWESPGSTCWGRLRPCCMAARAAGKSCFLAVLDLSMCRVVADITTAVLASNIVLRCRHNNLQGEEAGSQETTAAGVAEGLQEKVAQVKETVEEVVGQAKEAAAAVVDKAGSFLKGSLSKISSSFKGKGAGEGDDVEL